MANLAKIRAVTQKVVVDIDGEILNVEVNVNNFSMQQIALFESRNFDNPQDAINDLAQFICELLFSWDLYENQNDAMPIELTPEIVKGLPYRVLTEIITKVGDELKVGK